MPTFFPPVTYNATPKYHPNDVPWMKRLRARQSGELTGISVWILKDGTVTETQPWDNDTLERVYLGGHFYQISNAEAAILIAAGYQMQPEPAFSYGYVGGYQQGY